MSSQKETYSELEDSALAPLNTDQAMTKVGGMGRYQITSTIISALLFSLVG